MKLGVSTAVSILLVGIASAAPQPGDSGPLPRRMLFYFFLKQVHYLDQNAQKLSPHQPGPVSFLLQSTNWS